jgi:hypothetical protein
MYTIYTSHLPKDPHYRIRWATTFIQRLRRVRGLSCKSQQWCRQPRTMEAYFVETPAGLLFSSNLLNAQWVEPAQNSHRHEGKRIVLYITLYVDSKALLEQSCDIFHFVILGSITHNSGR